MARAIALACFAFAADCGDAAQSGPPPTQGTGGGDAYPTGADAPPQHEGGPVAPDASGEGSPDAQISPANPVDGTFYVSPTGNDSNPGTKEKPFLTVTRARDAVRPSIAAGLTTAVTIYLRGGTYLIEKPIELGKTDGGTDSFSVTYAAFPGETPIISGGKTITGWVLHQGNIWKTVIPEVAVGTWWFRDLFVDGARAIRARAPNYPGSGGAVASADLSNANAEAVSVYAWESSRRSITSLPITKDYVYLEHALAFVDQTSEWYLDKKTGTLYYMAAPGADPNKQTFIAPSAEQLLVVRGEPATRVKNLWWKGIAFHHAQWPFPAKGYNEVFSGQYYDTGVDSGLVRLIPPAVELEFIEKSGLEGCEIGHVGGTGLALGRGTVSSSVTGCEVFDAGAKGIEAGYRGRLSPDGLVKADVGCDKTSSTAAYWACYWLDDKNVPRDVELSDNYVHHIGRTYHGAIGLELHFVERFKLTYNLVHDTNYSALSFSNYVDVPDKGLVAFNQVHDFQKMEMPDGGGIYVTQDNNGIVNQTVIRSNYVPDGYIYLDGGPKTTDALFSLEANVTRDDYRIFQVKPDPQGTAKNQILQPNEAQMMDAAKRTGPREPHRSRFGLVDSTLTARSGQLR